MYVGAVHVAGWHSLKSNFDTQDMEERDQPGLFAYFFAGNLHLTLLFILAKLIAFTA